MPYMKQPKMSKTIIIIINNELFLSPSHLLFINFTFKKYNKPGLELNMGKVTSKIIQIRKARIPPNI